MRFLIAGADSLTGRDRIISIEAFDANEAEVRALLAGLFISDVALDVPRNVLEYYAPPPRLCWIDRFIIMFAFLILVLIVGIPLALRSSKGPASLPSAIGIPTTSISGQSDHHRPIPASRPARHAEADFKLPSDWCGTSRFMHERLLRVIRASVSVERLNRSVGPVHSKSANPNSADAAPVSTRCSVQRTPEPVITPE